MGEEELRAAYGTTSDKLSYEETTREFFRDLDTTVTGIKLNPINYTLGTFAKELLQNERVGLQIWTQMKNKIDDFERDITELSFYRESDIVKLFIQILDILKLWEINQRQSIILSKKKMEEVKKMVDEEYVAREKYESESDKWEMITDRNAKGIPLQVSEIAGKKMIPIPPIYYPQFTDKDKVLVRRMQIKE